MLALELADFWLTSGAWGAQKLQLALSMTLTPSAASGVSQSSRPAFNLTIPTNFPFYLQGLQTVNTGSRQALQLGSVTPLGYCLLHNCDNVNAVSLYSDSSASSELGRIDPNGVSLIQLAPSATPYLEALVAAVNVEIYLAAR